MASVFGLELLSGLQEIREHCEKVANDGHSQYCEWPSLATFLQPFHSVNTRVCMMVRKNQISRELSLKLLDSFHLNCDFEPFGLTGRAPEAFLATWFFSGTFQQTRRPEKATLIPKMFNYAVNNYHSGNNKGMRALTVGTLLPSLGYAREDFNECACACKPVGPQADLAVKLSGSSFWLHARVSEPSCSGQI